MSSRKAIVSAAASIVTALALVGCGESSVSSTSDNETISAQPGHFESWQNNYSYSQPEDTYDQLENAADRSQPAGALIPGNSSTTQPSDRW